MLRSPGQLLPLVVLSLSVDIASAMAASECDLEQGDRATAEEAALPDFDESASEDTGREPEVDDCALLGED